jgi:hypothetical protein
MGFTFIRPSGTFPKWAARACALRKAKLHAQWACWGKIEVVHESWGSCTGEGKEVNGGCDEDEISQDITGARVLGKSRWGVYHVRLKAMEGFSDHETHRAQLMYWCLGDA